tara:strand:- start:142 stop:570 length:429 start_codon:yes stop_codon:yes gene_type:complete
MGFDPLMLGTSYRFALAVRPGSIVPGRLLGTQAARHTLMVFNPLVTVTANGVAGGISAALVVARFPLRARWTGHATPLLDVLIFTTWDGWTGVWLGPIHRPARAADQEQEPQAKVLKSTACPGFFLSHRIVLVPGARGIIWF